MTRVLWHGFGRRQFLMIGGVLLAFASGGWLSRRTCSHRRPSAAANAVGESWTDACRRRFQDIGVSASIETDRPGACGVKVSARARPNLRADICRGGAISYLPKGVIVSRLEDGSVRRQVMFDAVSDEPSLEVFLRTVESCLVPPIAGPENGSSFATCGQVALK